jgi:transcriptional regulator with XRE-family HTH domain
MTTQGMRIKKIRQNLNLSQEEFGKIFDIQKQMVSSLEKDNLKLNNDKLVKLLCDYNVNINYLLSGKGEMFINEQNKIDLNKIDKTEFKKMFMECMKETGFI